MPQKFNTREIVITDPKKSSIDMSCSVKGSGKIGRLIPVFSQELLPNSTINYTPNTLARFVPLAAPLMSNMTIRHHMIAVPFRQLYKNWEKFITGGEFNTDDSTLGTFSIKDLVTVIMNTSDSWKLFPVTFSTPSAVATDMNDIFTQFDDKVQGLGDLFRQVLGAQIAQLTGSWTADKAAVWNTVAATYINMLIGTGSLLDYLGYPVRDYVALKDQSLTTVFKITTVSGIQLISGLGNVTWSNLRMSDAYIRAYYRIWYYYFRDQNLDTVAAGMTPEELMSVDSLFASSSMTNNKLNFMNLLILRPGCWTKDLFNTSTLQAYENNAFVPVSNKMDDDQRTIENKAIKVYDVKTATWNEMSVPKSWVDQMSDYQIERTKLLPQDYDDQVGEIMTGFSLKNLQKVEALAKWLDKNLYGGWHYADQLNSHFGIRYSDARMQLPEYVGGTKQMVNCQTLTNNTSTEQQIAGDQAAYAQGITANDSCKYFAEEHCIFIDIMSILPELSYKYASPAHLLHIKKMDFAFPEFAQLGCDIIPSFCVANSIVASDGENNDTNTLPFGYADRYYSYKSNVNRLTGKMVDDLKLYTFTQEFQSRNNQEVVNVLPKLNAKFVHCIPSTDVFVSDSPEYEFVFDHSASVKANIPLPVVQYV